MKEAFVYMVSAINVIKGIMMEVQVGPHGPREGIRQPSPPPQEFSDISSKLPQFCES